MIPKKGVASLAACITLLIAGCGSNGAGASQEGSRDAQPRANASSPAVAPTAAAAAKAKAAYETAATPPEALSVAAVNMSQLQTLKADQVVVSSDGSTSVKSQVSTEPKTVYIVLEPGPSATSEAMGLSGPVETLMRDGQLLVHSPSINQLAAKKHPGFTNATWIKAPKNADTDTLASIQQNPLTLLLLYKDSFSTVAKGSVTTGNGRALTDYTAHIEYAKLLQELQQQFPAAVQGATVDQLSTFGFPSTIDYYVSADGYIYQSNFSTSSGLASGNSTLNYFDFNGSSRFRVNVGSR